MFAAVLPYSGYAYAEAFLSQNQEAWITAHVNAYSYFGGVARILVPDNLKTGVIKHTKHEIVLNNPHQPVNQVDLLYAIVVTDKIIQSNQKLRVIVFYLF